jgi:hypothetical protein
MPMNEKLKNESNTVAANEISTFSPFTDNPLHQIRNAWLAGAVLVCLSFIRNIFSMISIKNTGFSPWNFLDTALILIFAFGIYKKSRCFAIFMLTYYVATLFLNIVQNGLTGGYVLMLAFLYFFAFGIAGTFEYQKLKRNAVITDMLDG